MMRDRDEGIDMGFTVITNLLTVLVTLLGVLLTNSLTGLSKHVVTAGTLVAIIVVLVALGTVYLRTYLGELRAANRQSRWTRLTTASVPSLVSFKSRTDLLVVSENGDAVLTWEFDLESPDDESISELTFPVFAETTEDTVPWSSLVLKRLTVNGEERSTSGAFIPVEQRASRSPSRPSVEYALLKVPVELGLHHTSCTVSVTMEFKRVFANLQELEHFFVDVPYLTESLRVIIRSDEGTVRRPLDHDVAVLAMSGQTEVHDRVESHDQDKSYEHLGRAVRWVATAPKLGYRYKVAFRVESLGQSGLSAK